MLIGNTRIGGIGSLSVKNTYDPDALAYLTAVEAADGQALENSVKIAINTFVVGCKTDGNWSALTNACIMAGARSVAGAIVPLVGNAPTNNNFVSGDYSRKTGLLGDASSKYLLTAYNNVNFPTDNVHISCYVTQSPSLSATVFRTFVGGASGIGGRIYLSCNTSGALALKNRSSATGGILITGEGTTTGFKGHSRNSATNTIIRSSQANTTNTTASTTLVSQAIGVFYNGLGSQQSDARMSFYSLGTNIDLALLDARITTLMTTLNALL
jgi:hypothetical protein